jgi:hypothetical protein
VDWRIGVRRNGNFSTTEIAFTGKLRHSALPLASSLLVLAFVLGAALPSSGKKKDGVAYGEGLIVNIPLPESEVERVVQDIAANGIIRGTKEYNKDEFVSGANIAYSSTVFPEWTQGGKIFYKVRLEALDPRNFKDSADLGTLAVRYVVKAQGPKNTILRIDAVFKEDFRHTVHPSSGSVESDEYRDIQDHLDFLELMKKQDVEAIEQRQEKLAKKQNVAMQPASSPAKVAESSSSTAPPVDNSAVAAPTQTASASPQAAPAISTGSNVSPQVENSPAAAAVGAQPLAASTVATGQNLEERVKALRSQVERVVKAPGAPLKSAPFHTATTLQSLPTGTEVLILIATPYWYGVETHDGQHGWVMLDNLEQR